MFDFQPFIYPTDMAKIALMVNVLFGKAAQWATAIIENHTSASTHCDTFYAEFSRVFDNPIKGAEAAAKLLSLC